MAVSRHHRGLPATQRKYLALASNAYETQKQMNETLSKPRPVVSWTSRQRLQLSLLGKDPIAELQVNIYNTRKKDFTSYRRCSLAY